MFQSPSYPEPERAEVLAFIRSQFHVKVIAVDEAGFPLVSLLPFVYLPGTDGAPDRAEIHMVQADSTFQALAKTRRATLLFDQPLAVTPHHWVRSGDAGMATLHFRAVQCQAEARPETDPAVVAEFLGRLMEVYEPKGEYTPLETGSIYDGRLKRLAAVSLTVVHMEAKFKVAQNQSPDVRARLIDELRARAGLTDGIAANVMEWPHRYGILGSARKEGEDA